MAEVELNLSRHLANVLSTVQQNSGLHGFGTTVRSCSTVEHAALTIDGSLQTAEDGG